MIVNYNCKTIIVQASLTIITYAHQLQLENNYSIFLSYNLHLGLPFMIVKQL